MVEGFDICDGEGIELHYNEFVVYDASQVRLRYLVRVRFD